MTTPEHPPTQPDDPKQPDQSEALGPFDVPYSPSDFVHSPADIVLDVAAFHAHKAAVRSDVALAHCERKGWPTDPDALSIAQVLEIRALPEWINAGTAPTKELA